MIARSRIRRFQRRFFGHACVGQHSGACMITSVEGMLRDQARTVYWVSIAHPHPSHPFPNCNAGQSNKLVPTRPRGTMSQKHSSNAATTHPIPHSAIRSFTPALSPSFFPSNNPVAQFFTWLTLLINACHQSGISSSSSLSSSSCSSSWSSLSSFSSSSSCSSLSTGVGFPPSSITGLVGTRSGTSTPTGREMGEAVGSSWTEVDDDVGKGGSAGVSTFGAGPSE